MRLTGFATLIRDKLFGSQTIAGKLSRAAVKEPEVAARCAAAAALASPSSLIDAPTDTVRIASLQSSLGTSFLEANNFYRTQFGVSDQDLARGVNLKDPKPEDIPMIRSYVAKQYACAAGTLTGAVVGGVGTGVAVAGITGGIGTVAVSFKAATGAQAAYNAAAITIQASSTLLLADTAVGVSREVLAPH